LPIYQVVDPESLVAALQLMEKAASLPMRPFSFAAPGLGACIGFV
jgi:hypothetical protein